MKKFLLSLLIFLWITDVLAQQRPQFTQYLLNNYLLNPAITGIERYIDIKLGYRAQWVGLPGAPVTKFLSAYLPIGKNYIFSNSGSFHEIGNNPSSRSYLQTYRAAEPHHGIGFYVISDQAGPFEDIELDLTYAYHMGLAPRLNLALGISAGISKDILNASKIDASNQNDPAVINSFGTNINPELGTGLWLYGPTFFLGLSAQQLLGKLSTLTANGQEVPHFYMTGGYKFMVSEEISALPSLMFKYINPSPISMEINAKMMFKDIFWIGAGFRKGDSVSALMGVNINSLFNIGYAYDLPTSSLRTTNSGSHEVILGLLLNNKYKVTCPQRLW